MVEKIKSDPLNLLVNTIVGKHGIGIYLDFIFCFIPLTDKAFFIEGGIFRLDHIQN